MLLLLLQPWHPCFITQASNGLMVSTWTFLGVSLRLYLVSALQQYLQDNIFDPLELNSMGFSVNSKDKKSFTTLYTSGALQHETERLLVRQESILLI